MSANRRLTPVLFTPLASNVMNRLTFSPLLILLFALLLPAASASGQEQRSLVPVPADTAAHMRVPEIVRGSLDGPIGPISEEYVTRLLGLGRARNAVCVLFTIDTPGGLDTSMRGIIKQILASPVPVVVYIYPAGARAASAGALITLAAHVAAMCPGTNIGAAHPVAIGEGEMDDDMAAKVTNDAAAYARSIAKQRNRSVEWAERIVRESISSTPAEVKELGVIDFIADDIQDLLSLIDGMRVEAGGDSVTIVTAGATVVAEPPTLRERFLARISDPNIAYLLMLLGIFGLFFELQNPGGIFPGVIGAISIISAAFALQLLPVNISGIALIILAIIMFVLEIKVPSGGLLTVGGVVSMVIGSIMFIDSPLPFMRVSLGVIIPAVIFTALFFLFAVGMGIRAQRTKVRTGEGGIVGETGVARSDIDPEGTVFIHGEYWNAFSDTAIPAGSKVVAVAVTGMKLKVTAVEQEEVS